MSNPILEEFLLAAGHEITGGTEYQWRCWGPNARFINCENRRADAYAIWDTETQDVYEIAVQSDQFYYRWLNPDFIQAYKDEAKARKIAWDHAGDPNDPDYKDTRWRMTDEVSDICSKVHAIRNGLAFDERVIMTLSLETDVIAGLALGAHHQGVTLNEFIVGLLVQEVERVKAERKARKAAKKAAKGK